METGAAARQLKMSIWSRVLIVSALLFAPVNHSLAQDPTVSTLAYPIPCTPTTQKSRFDGILTSVRPTDPAHLFVEERAAGGFDHVIRLDIYLGRLSFKQVFSTGAGRRLFMTFFSASSYSLFL